MEEALKSFLEISHREMRDQVHADDSWLRSLRAALVAVEPVHRPIDLGNGVRLLAQHPDNTTVRLEITNART